MWKRIKAAAVIAAVVPPTVAPAQDTPTGLSRSRLIANYFASSVTPGASDPVRSYTSNRGQCVRLRTPACRRFPNLSACRSVSPSVPCDDN